MKDVKPSDRVTRGGAARWDGEAKASLKSDMCSKTGNRKELALRHAEKVQVYRPQGGNHDGGLGAPKGQCH